jgi:hypothetical protein
VSSEIKHMKLWVVFLIGAAALLLTACSSAPETTYSCYGNASSLWVEYTGEDGVMAAESVSLPWTQSVVIGRNELYIVLSATNESDTGDFTCEIIVDDHTVMTAEGAGGLEISGDYQKSGNTAEANFSSSFIPHEQPIVELAEEEPAEEPAAEEAPAADPDTGLEVINSLAVPFCNIYLTGSDAPDWGDNRLMPADYILMPGDSFIIPNIDALVYDMIVEDCEGNIVALLNKTELSPGLWIDVSSYENDRHMTFVNNSSADICSISAGDSETNRTRNILTPDTPLAVGSEKRLVIGRGVLTVWGATCDGQEFLVEGIDLMADDYTLAINDNVLAGNLTANIRFINSTSADICGIYLIDDPRTGWGGNYLTSAVVSGEDFTINDVPQAVFSYKIESCNSIFLGWGYDIDFAEVVADMGTTDLTMTVSEQSLILIKNTSSLDICGLYVRHTGEEEWFTNLLNSGVSIDAGQGVALNMGAATYDFHVDSCAGDVQELLAQDIYDGYEWDITD